MTSSWRNMKWARKTVFLAILDIPVLKQKKNQTERVSTADARWTPDSTIIATDPIKKKRGLLIRWMELPLPLAKFHFSHLLWQF